MPAETVKIHLDTDLGGDIDDLCALALLLADPRVEITGITTVADDGGRRRGYVKYVLRLAGRPEIPVAAGADVSLGYFRDRPGYPDEAAYWPESVAPSPNPLEEALDLLRRSVERGATVVAIGPIPGLPDDTINFLHDPLACAVALGWDGVAIETLPLRAELGDDGYLRAVTAADGKPTRVVTGVDGNRFGAWWYQALTR